MVIRTKPNKRPKRFLTVVELRRRWGNVSQQFIERRLVDDPLFPRPMQLPRGRLRLFDEEKIEEYERRAVTK
jgi:hypothetical protein